MMKRFAGLVLSVFLAAGCAHNPSGSSLTALPEASPILPAERQTVLTSSSPSGAAEAKTRESAENRSPGFSELSLSTGSSGGPATEVTKSDNATLEEENPEEKTDGAMADPLEPFNRAMFQFNDKLYFWLLKPVAQGYKKVVPEPARKGVKNFFSNLGFPVRFVSSLLQGDLKGAAAELGRFAVNTLWGAGGFLDPSSGQQLNIPKREADLGQTLGFYGIGQGFFIIWPFLGPSSARDSLGMIGDYYLNPLSYISPWYDSVGVKSYREVNDTSFRIGDYESFLEATIDPYVAMRDAYTQYRLKKVQMGKGKQEPPKPAGLK